MMRAMTDWNFMTAIMVVALFALWNLEFAATLLNLKAFPSQVPAELTGLMDAAKLDQARDYLRVNARFGIVQSAWSLAVLLVFWFAGGFGWLDGWARSIATVQPGLGMGRAPSTPAGMLTTSWRVAELPQPCPTLKVAL